MDQHQEFVLAAEAAGFRSAAATLGQALADDLEQLVAGRVTEPVVDALEAVEVHVEKRTVRRALPRFVEPLLQPSAVAEPVSGSTKASLRLASSPWIAAIARSRCWRTMPAVISVKTTLCRRTSGRNWDT